jgi:hypothetical protein
LNLPAALNLVEPLDRQTLGERAYAKLADLLMSGRLAPGEKLSLRAAADVLGVSIMPVREAVSRLVADKALEVTPNRAVRVPLMSAAQFRDLTKVRIAIEGHAAGQAALHRDSNDLVSIARAEEAMRLESEAPVPDLPRAVELNKTFHFAVYEAAHSQGQSRSAGEGRCDPVSRRGAQGDRSRPWRRGAGRNCRRHQGRGGFHSFARRTCRLTFFQPTSRSFQWISNSRVCACW